jgi:AhpC/TSA family protein
MTDAGRRTDPFTAFLMVACVVLAGLVVALTLQNRTLKSQMAHAAGPAPDQFKAGDVVTPFEVVDDGGVAKTIRFGDGERKTVLFVFSSQCPACKQTLPKWKEMFKTPAADGVRVVGIQTDRLDANPSQPGLPTAAFPFPVYGYKRPEQDPLRKVPFIPAAIVVDTHGVVTNAWFGVPESSQEEGLKKALAG